MSKSSIIVSNSFYLTSLFALLAGFHLMTQMAPGDLI